MCKVIIIIGIVLIFSTLFLSAIFLWLLASNKDEIWGKITFSKKGD